MALKTKDIKAPGEGGLSKTLRPGNEKCKLNGITLEENKFKPGAVYIMLYLEGPDLGESFEGFWLNKDDQSLGRHKGQVGKVKHSYWAFSDGQTKSGVKITKDAEILKFIKNLCIELDCVKWLDAQDDKHDTIESLIEAFNTQKPFEGKVIEYCLAGKEYNNNAGYKSYELFLPKYSKSGSAFGKNVAQFNPKEHIVLKKDEPVEQFAPDNNTELSGSASSDFSLDD